MKTMVLFLTIACISAMSTTGAVLFDPTELETRKSTWHVTSGEHKGEYYVDYLIKDNVVFRVLTRYTPSVDGIIVNARMTHGQLRLADPTIIYFDSKELIRDNFSIAHEGECHRVNVDPSPMSLWINASGCFGGKRTYMMSFSDDTDDIVISKRAYFALKLSRSLALSQGKGLSIDLHELRRSNPNTKNLVSVVERKMIEESNYCVICNANVKNTMIKPCNHLCLCQECAEHKQLTACPMCRGDIASKEKVFY